MATASNGLIVFRRCCAVGDLVHRARRSAVALLLGLAVACTTAVPSAATAAPPAAAAKRAADRLPSVALRPGFFGVIGPDGNVWDVRSACDQSSPPGGSDAIVKKELDGRVLGVYPLPPGICVTQDRDGLLSHGDSVYFRAQPGTSATLLPATSPPPQQLLGRVRTSGELSLIPLVGEAISTSHPPVGAAIAAPDGGLWNIGGTFPGDPDPRGRLSRIDTQTGVVQFFGALPLDANTGLPSYISLGPNKRIWMLMVAETEPAWLRFLQADLQGEVANLSPVVPVPGMARIPTDSFAAPADARWVVAGGARNGASYVLRIDASGRVRRFAIPKFTCPHPVGVAVSPKGRLLLYVQKNRLLRSSRCERGLQTPFWALISPSGRITKVPMPGVRLERLLGTISASQKFGPGQSELERVGATRVVLYGLAKVPRLRSPFVAHIRWRQW